ncbi:MAG TPA: hypothetical protein VGM20_07995 [Gemmatimonadales bacterium]|jgi:hypothetical protein
MKVRSLWLAVLLASPAVAAAQGGSHGSDAYLGVRFGTLGIGGELSKLLTSHIGARVGLNFFSASTTQTEKDISYDASLKLQAFTGLIDLYPGNRGSFHLTGGVMTSPLKITATGQANGSDQFTINHHTYDSVGVGTLTATAKWKTLPYVGLGFGTAAGKHSGLKFVFDLGAGIGKPTVLLNATGNAPGLQNDVLAQQDTTQKSLNKLGVYPVLNFGLVYRF